MSEPGPETFSAVPGIAWPGVLNPGNTGIAAIPESAVIALGDARLAWEAGAPRLAWAAGEARLAWTFGAARNQ